MVGIGTRQWAGQSRNGGPTERPAVSFHESLRQNTNSKDHTKNKLRRGSENVNKSLNTFRATTPCNEDVLKEGRLSFVYFQPRVTTRREKVSSDLFYTQKQESKYRLDGTLYGS